MVSRCQYLAVTSQWMSVLRNDVDWNQIKPKWVTDNICIGGFESCTRPLNTRSMWGNRFSIVLRELSQSLEDVEESLKSFSTTGFINYYSAQRFGTGPTPTCEVGRQLIIGNFKKCVEIIVSSRKIRGYDQESIHMMFCDKKYDDLLKILPGFCEEQRAIIKHLNSYPEDFKGAVQVLPPKRIEHFIITSLSAVWNDVVSHRLEIMGNKLEGVPGEMCISEDMDEDSIIVSGGKSVKTIVDSSSVDNIVMPTVSIGLDSMMGPKYPKVLKDCYNQVLDNYMPGWTLDNVDAKLAPILHSNNSITRGNVSMRHVMMKAKDFSYSLAPKRDDGGSPIVYSEMRKDKSGFVLDPMIGMIGDESSDVPEVFSNTHDAAVLHFSLPMGSFPEEVVRELTRQV
eukprot:GHVL01003481.1.p1 GENE.GHVL01003481.1~~GHVL01003481.1.p1  ORF type:complete len:397 (+),score=52.42 GHVL01003481.1:361-1551(+)